MQTTWIKYGIEWTIQKHGKNEVKTNLNKRKKVKNYLHNRNSLEETNNIIAQ